MIDPAELYETYADRVRGWFRTRVPRHDPQLADELTATVFEKVVRTGARLDGPVELPKSWIFRIAKTTLIDWFAKHRPEVGLPDLDRSRATVDAGSDAQLDALDVHRGLEGLPPKYRRILTDRFVRDLDYADLVGETGQTVSALKGTQYRALGALRDALA